MIKEEHDVEQLNRQIARMDHKEITIYDNHQKLLDRSQFTKHFQQVTHISLNLPGEHDCGSNPALNSNDSNISIISNHSSSQRSLGDSGQPADVTSD